ncbi:beta-phosphoglucomutase [Iodidimonas gelatinilytica]|uniref:Beta-phosphoglucomutase n=1 Tax=Iodidimonas gelatinilytica TaxID=1236966 RepID=A0A5A7MNA4_9PROT|nr:beta-phosphoglucomutase [Iodidimonas gelatinilytica]GEQ96379.1 beta-phosphoglucomutase [Iodidimonas gelatinilytica]
MSQTYKAVLFDLDGVLADSAREHYAAWKRLADELGLAFDEQKNERLKGVSRMASLDILLEDAPRPYSDAEKHALATRKNGYYQAIIQKVTPDALLPGARQALEACKALGLKTALASASRNAPLLIDRLGIGPLMDFIADAGAAKQSKPAPDIFLMAAKGVAEPPERCLALDDAAAGVLSAKAAGCYVVGVGDADILAAANAIIPDIAAFDPKSYLD